MFEPERLTINIRQNMKNFFVDQIIKQTPFMGTGKDQENCIILVDEVTEKILDSFLGMVDLVEAGIVGIFPLYKARKQMPKFHAIYFIEPSQSSIQYLQNDFDAIKKEQEEKEGLQSQIPMYDFVHLVFVNFIGEFDIKDILKNKELAAAVTSVRQVNMNVRTIDNNVYSLNFKLEEKLFTLELADKHTEPISQLVQQAMSLYTLLGKVESVMLLYQKWGPTEKFISTFKLATQKLLNDAYEQKTEKEEYVPPLVLVVLNRGFDMVTPFLSGMSYLEMYYNQLQLKGGNMLEYEIELENSGKQKKYSFLNEKDTIWRNFRYESFFPSMKKVSENLQNFVQRHTREKGSTNILVEKLRIQPQFQEILQEYSRHLQTMLKIAKQYKDKNFKTMYAYEQGLATKYQKTGEPFGFEGLKKTQLARLRPLDRIRLGLIAHFALGIETIQVNRNILIDDEEKMTYKALYNIFEKAKFKKAMNLQVDKESPGNNPTYYTPEIAKIYKKIVKGDVFKADKKFPLKKVPLYPSQIQETQRCFEKNVFQTSSSPFGPKKEPGALMFFVIGGMSYGEIVYLNNLAQQKGDLRLIMGGTSVNTAFTYVKNYTELSSKRKEEEKRLREMKKQEKIRKMNEEANKANMINFDEEEEGKQLDINIRQNLRNFFLEEVIGTCPYIGTGKDRKNCLLILDQNTSKVLDKFMGVIDLIEGGIIGIERLDCLRKQFKQFHAIYFIEPTTDSLTKVINDFKDKKTNDEGNLTEQGPLYDFCHIIFNGPVSNEQLARLANHKNLVYALLSIRQVFLDLEVVDETLFNLNIPNELDFFQSFDSKNQENIDLLTNKTLSIFTLLKKVESIQIIYEKNGAAQLLGANMREKSQKMIDVICKNKISQQAYPPVFLVIVNRGFDLLTPLMRSFTYGGLYYDIIKMKKAILEFEVDQDGQKVQQTSTLNEQDAIWLNYKYQNFNKALKEIVGNYNEFLKKNFGQQDENEDALENMQRLPELQEFLKDFNKHIHNLKKIKQMIQDQNFVDVFNFEQGLATQRKSDGQDFLEGDVDFSKVVVSEDRIRLGLLAKFSLDLDTQHVKDTYLTNDDEKNLFEEVYKKMLIFQQKKKDYLKGKEKLEEEDIQYYIPRASLLIEDLVKNQLFSKSEFKEQFNHYEIHSKNSNTKLFEQNLFEKKQGLFDQKGNEPIVVYLVLGGLSMNEQICLNELKENSQNLQFKLIFGGTSVNSSFQFIDKLSPQKDIDEPENYLSKQDIEIVDKNSEIKAADQEEGSQNIQKEEEEEEDDEDEEEDEDEF